MRHRTRCLSYGGLWSPAIILADQKLLFVEADGVLVLVKPSSRGFQKLAEKKIATMTLRALPALSNGR
ncbi:MAG TPA: hypothetical protein QF761_07865 [Pirellulales bacterium]|nr:hypothetical protein [Pirellulales bacterium]